LKPGFHFIGARVESRRLQATGKTGCNLYSPTDDLDDALHAAVEVLVLGKPPVEVQRVNHRIVAVQVAFESKCLIESSFSLDRFKG
jgi:hypothetical protein